MMRGNVGNDLFFSSEDRTRFLLLLQEGIERYRHRVHAFCLMTNHVHLLIQVGTIPLARIIQNISFRYTRYINHKNQEVGHLFQGRYKAILVDSDQYLLELTRYIHLNPVRAGLCDTASDFEWSSHHAYMGTASVPWLYKQEVLGRFSEDAVKARQLLHSFIEEGAGEGSRPDFQTGSHPGQILGDDDFAERALNATGQSCFVKPPALAEIIDIVCRECHLDKSVLYEAGSSRQPSEGRAMVAWVVQNMDGLTLTSLADELGRDLSTLSQAAGRLRQRMGEDALLQSKAEKILGVVQNTQ